MWIRVEVATDLVMARTMVKTTLTARITSKGAQLWPSWLEWISAKRTDVTATAGPTPARYATAGERKPRKNNSSPKGATKIPNAASISAELVSRKYFSTG